MNAREFLNGGTIRILVSLCAVSLLVSGCSNRDQVLSEKVAAADAAARRAEAAANRAEEAARHFANAQNSPEMVEAEPEIQDPEPDSTDPNSNGAVHG